MLCVCMCLKMAAIPKQFMQTFCKMCQNKAQCLHFNHVLIIFLLKSNVVVYRGRTEQTNSAFVQHVMELAVEI